jgi:predicted NBD/HSP70 family sugar kinase
MAEDNSNGLTPTRHAKATKQDSRRSNLRTTLELVSDHRQTSRAEISRQTGLTRAAVSSLVNELIDQGFLREMGQGTSAGGKPPTLLALNERGRDIIAVDLGDRPFRASLVDLGGRIHHRAESPTPGSRPPTGDKARRQTIDLIGSLLERSQAPILGIGVGTPGVVDSQGMVVEAANLDWHRLNLGADLEREFGVPVSMANDAQIAALAELRRRPAHQRNLILVKVGWGIGAGVVIDGVLHRGDHAAAGEIGHIQVVDGGEACLCGNRGCLETVASVPSILRRIGADPERHRWDALDLAGLAGDEAVRRSLTEAGRHLGTVLATVVSALDVSTIVVASELRNAGDVLAEQVRAEVSQRVLPTIAPLVQVEVTPLGPDLVMAGAAAAVLADRLGVVLR